MYKILIILTLFSFTESWADDIKIDSFSDTFSAELSFDVDSEEKFSIPALISIFDKSSNKNVLEIESSFSKYELEEGRLSSNVQELPYGEQSIIIADDYNFDGLSDLAIRNRDASCYGGPAYDVYLNKRGKLIFSEELSRLASEYCGMFDVDSVKKELYTMTKSGCCWHEYSTFKFKNEKLEPLKIIELSHQTYPFVTTDTQTWKNNVKTETSTKVIGYESYDDIEQIFSFTVKENNKKVILFVAGETLFYALLKKNGKDVEFSYPDEAIDRKDNSWTLNDEWTKLTFKNEGATYEIYEKYKGSKLINIGLLVKVKGKTYDLKGDVKTVKGKLRLIVDQELDFSQLNWKG